MTVHHVHTRSGRPSAVVIDVIGGGGATEDEQVSPSSRRLQRRSQLGEGRRRDREMRFRVSDEEYKEICEAAHRAGVAYGTFIVHTVQGVNRQHRSGHELTLNICDELRGIARQLNRIDVNLNQLARIANTTGQVPHELPAALAYLQNVLRRVGASSVELGRLQR